MKDKFTVGGMSEQESLQLAAQAWCGDKTRYKVLDPELAKEFARILRREVNRKVSNEA